MLAFECCPNQYSGFGFTAVSGIHSPISITGISSVLVLSIKVKLTKLHSWLCCIILYYPQLFRNTAVFWTGRTLAFYRLCSGPA